MVSRAYYECAVLVDVGDMRLNTDMDVALFPVIEPWSSLSRLLLSEQWHRIVSANTLQSISKYKHDACLLYRHFTHLFFSVKQTFHVPVQPNLEFRVIKPPECTRNVNLNGWRLPCRNSTSLPWHPDIITRDIWHLNKWMFKMVVAELPNSIHSPLKNILAHLQSIRPLQCMRFLPIILQIVERFLQNTPHHGQKNYIYPV